MKNNTHSGGCLKTEMGNKKREGNPVLKTDSPSLLSNREEKLKKEADIIFSKFKDIHFNQFKRIDIDRLARFHQLSGILEGIQLGRELQKKEDKINEIKRTEKIFGELRQENQQLKAQISILSRERSELQAKLEEMQMTEFEWIGLFVKSKVCDLNIEEVIEILKSKGLIK